MRRREFISFFGTLAVWPLAARAQQSARVKRVGVLIPFEMKMIRKRGFLPAFKQRLGELGWVEGRNIQFDVHFTTQNIDQIVPAPPRSLPAIRI